jgi:hypothetical protein
MSLLFDIREVAISTIVERYQQVLGSAFVVKVGWVGNEPLPTNKHVLAFQIASDDTTPLSVVVVDHDDPTPPIPPVVQARIQHGRLLLGVTGTLYVQSQQQGKSLRSDALRRVHAVIPRTVGKAPALIIPASPSLQSLIHWTHDRTTVHDEPEGIKRNEWRATLFFTLRTSLLDSIELPYCREIQTSMGNGQFHPVDAVLP